MFHHFFFHYFRYTPDFRHFTLTFHFLHFSFFHAFCHIFAFLRRFTAFAVFFSLFTPYFRFLAIIFMPPFSDYYSLS